jgi:FixJ family two-component response regulator
MTGTLCDGAKPDHGLPEFRRAIVARQHCADPGDTAVSFRQWGTRRDTSIRPPPESRGCVVTERSKSPHETASVEEPIVFVIDDDVAMRATLSSLFRSMGLRVELFGSAREFAQMKMPDVASCLVLDIRLPGVSGLDFQAELAEADIRIPIIFMTGHGDIPMSVKAMKAGAIDFLTKPFRDQDILDAVTKAIERDQKRRDSQKGVSEVQIRFDSLTSREREVMRLVAAGLMNKQIAAELGVVEITVKVHRGHMMRKMKAMSLVHLVEMADLLGIRRPKR